MAAPRPMNTAKRLLGVSVLSMLACSCLACRGPNSGGEERGSTPVATAGPGPTSEDVAAAPSLDSADPSSGDASASEVPMPESSASDASGSHGEVYANVTAVAVSGTEGAYNFSVTVESADIDCSQFADWWEVLSEAGELRYRRILTHSHTDENGTTDPNQPGNSFTRDGGPVAIASDATVLVRAHMNSGGYRGRVMRGSAADGFAEATDVPPDFAPEVESLEPQPGGCQF